MEHFVIKFLPCAFTPTFERERDRARDRARDREREGERDRQRDRETERKRERQWGQLEGMEAPTYLQKKEE